MRVFGVFEGGGIRGFAHIGALRALRRRRIEFEQVAGASIGAIVAALVAAGYTAEELYSETEPGKATGACLVVGLDELFSKPDLKALRRISRHLGRVRWAGKWLNPFRLPRAIRDEELVLGRVRNLARHAVRVDCRSNRLFQILARLSKCVAPMGDGRHQRAEDFGWTPACERNLLMCPQIETSVFQRFANPVARGDRRCAGAHVASCRRSGRGVCRGCRHRVRVRSIFLSAPACWSRRVCGWRAFVECACLGL